MLTIFNSLSRQKETFVPITSNKVKIYVCGMTVYDYCHVGHARVMVTFDVISRYLRTQGYDVTYVRNITDIDDKIINRAHERGVPIQEITEFFINAMHEDEKLLGNLLPDREPRVTEVVPQMVSMIDQLLKKGY